MVFNQRRHELAAMARKPIIADVAWLAGVSTATVDRVLSDRGGVKPDKAAAVLSAARRLRLDRMLTRKYSRVERIAVLIQSSANPFHAALSDAFSSASRAYADLNLQFLVHHIAFDDARGTRGAGRRRSDGAVPRARRGRGRHDRRAPRTSRARGGVQASLSKRHPACRLAATLESREDPERAAC
jgi:hypothetical protein